MKSAPALLAFCLLSAGIGSFATTSGNAGAGTTTTTTTGGGTTSTTSDNTSSSNTSVGAGGNFPFNCSAWDGSDLSDYSTWLTNTTANDICVVTTNGAALCEDNSTIHDTSGNGPADGMSKAFGYDLKHAQTGSCNDNKHHCFVSYKMGLNTPIEWRVGGNVATVNVTYLKFSICKYFCEMKDGTCDCSKVRCGVKKQIYDCTCAVTSGSTNANCPVNNECPSDTHKSYGAFPAMQI